MGIVQIILLVLSLIKSVPEIIKVVVELIKLIRALQDTATQKMTFSELITAVENYKKTGSDEALTSLKDRLSRRGSI